MRRRGGILLLILAIVIAIASTWFNDLWISYQRNHNQLADKSRISYYFTEFSLQSSNAEGVSEYKLRGQHFSHWTGKDTSEIIQPRLYAYKQNKQSTQMTADSATLFHKQDIVELQGAARIINTASGTRTSLEAENLRYHPNKQWIETDSRIRFSSGNSKITGKGMDSKLDENILRIHADVRSIFDAK